MTKPADIPHDQQNRAAISLMMLGFALIVRFVNLLCLQHAPFFAFKIGDAARYDAWAQRIADGDWIGQGVFYQAPLYPYFLGSIYSLLGNDIMTVRKVQAVLGAFACVLLMNAVWNLFNRRAAIAAGFIMALYVPSIFLETMLQKSVLDLFFICLIIWLISKLQLRSTARRWIGLGASLGALCLTRENALALIPCFLMWATLFPFIHRVAAKAEHAQESRPRLDFRRSALFSALLVVGLLMTLGPVALRNYVIGGELHITTSQLGPNFYIGNHAGANGTYEPLVFARGNAEFEQADAVAIAEADLGRELSAAEVSDYFLNKSLHYIREQPLDWLQLTFTKLLYSVNTTELIDTDDQYTWQEFSPLLWLLSPLFQFGTLATLAACGFWQQRRRWRELGIFSMMLAVFQLTLVLFFVFGRYRFPMVPLLVIFAAPGVAELAVLGRNHLQRIRARFTRTTSPSQKPIGLLHLKPTGLIKALAVLLILIVCHLPLISTDSARAVTLNNFGVQMLLRSEWEQAEAYFEACLELTPGDALAHNNLGVLYRECGKFELAQKHFQRAIELAPDYETAKRNLGGLASL
jgi:4-amino-4-deoxy-L-arabinose transferase-like glycosyltransferase